MRSSFFVFAAVVAAATVGCSSQRTSDDAVASSRQAIQGGTTDTTHRYSVGVCIGGRSSCNGICTGTLITPNVVVTARHCVDNSPNTINCSINPTFGPRKTNTIDITTHHDMFNNVPAASWFRVQSIAVPQDNHICGNDLAILVLQTQVPASQATPVIPGVQYPMNDSGYRAQFTAIGYGNTSPSGGGSGLRRIRSAIPILCIPGDKKRPCPSEFNAKEFIAGDGTCSGDSGSGAFEELSFQNNNPVNFGVLSRGGVSDDGATCQGSVYTRLDQFRDLVINTARTASSNWTLYPEPVWTTFVPPKVEPPRPDAGPGPQLPIGEACETNEACASGACVDPGTGTFVCTQACSDQGLDCPEGFTCQAELCFAPTEGSGGGGSTVKTTKEGCAAAPENHGATWTYGAILGAAIAVSAARRRRSAPK